MWLSPAFFHVRLLSPLSHKSGKTSRNDSVTIFCESACCAQNTHFWKTHWYWPLYTSGRGKMKVETDCRGRFWCFWKTARFDCWYDWSLCIPFSCFCLYGSVISIFRISENFVPYNVMLNNTFSLSERSKENFLNKDYGWQQWRRNPSFLYSFPIAQLYIVDQQHEGKNFEAALRK